MLFHMQIRIYVLRYDASVLAYHNEDNHNTVTQIAAIIALLHHLLPLPQTETGAALNRYENVNMNLGSREGLLLLSSTV